MPERATPVHGRGEGLPGMRERTGLLGGTLTVESAPGSGTRIDVSAPLPRHHVGIRLEEGQL
jgi:signal transduction histidine kinase